MTPQIGNQPRRDRVLPKFAGINPRRLACEAAKAALRQARAGVVDVTVKVSISK